MPARILVIDRDQATIHWLEAKLTAEGYSVDGATRGDLALQKIAQATPDLIVLDLSSGAPLERTRTRLTWLVQDYDGNLLAR